jgi:hypothetical protein
MNNLRVILTQKCKGEKLMNVRVYINQASKEDTPADPDEDLEGEPSVPEGFITDESPADPGHPAKWYSRGGASDQIYGEAK